jgi:hypothetical protein
MGNNNTRYFIKRFAVFEKLLKKEPDVERVILGNEEKAKGVTVIHSNLLLVVYFDKRSPCLRIAIARGSLSLEANEVGSRRLQPACIPFDLFKNLK